MRLLDARTLALETFVDYVPSYAILSHCWGNEEVVFADLANLDAARKKQGFAKIERTCEQAIKDKLDYVWIDTCCIDKSSSAELSEAINSMFAWYRGAEKCYAYLADVSGLHDISNSKWFSRSWTLQELLAPSTFSSDDCPGFQFFSRDWLCMGSKASLSNTISRRTGIPREYLEGKSLDTASVSMRMSWAADRQATRAEDIAYSLLGIFDVNMPLLYGEGKHKAFRRLQEEIMKISEDETLFAWESMEFATDASTVDVLASDPKDFSEASGLVPFASEDRVVPYTMTHRGLRIWLQLILPDISGRLPGTIRPLRSPVMIWSSHDQSLIWAILRCHMVHDFHHNVIIPLRHLSADIYVRDTSTNAALIPSDTILDTSHTSMQEIYIRNSRISSISSSIRRRFGFLIRRLPENCSIARAIPTEHWQPSDNIIQAGPDDNGSWHVSIVLWISLASQYQEDPPTVHMLFMSLGCKREPGDTQPSPWCHIDASLRFLGKGNLQTFHDSVDIKSPHLVSQSRYSKTIRDDVTISVQIIPRKVFGQDMFVVDLYLMKGKNLAVPTRTSAKQGPPPPPQMLEQESILAELPDSESHVVREDPPA